MHHDLPGILKRHGYTEIKKIGEGSFGKAILVQSDDGSKLVCKMVDVSSASPKETQDAVKEGRLLAAFKHPYVVRYRESFIDSGWLCILMDYCEGGDLARQIDQAKKKRQPIPEDQILRWITQALLALKYIHDKHVLHRDLKSSNFFLSKSGNLKMGDFGIAKVLASTAACARTQIGTPYYLSPEVCKEQPYTWPSDIWAMGCILYELCALKVPFDAANITGLVQKICRGPTPSIPQPYSDFIRQLCTEMLNRNPSNRPSAESILQRPRIQAIVKMMLDEAQAAQQASASNGTASDSGEGVGERRNSSDPVDGLSGMPAPSSISGPYADFAGSYRKGDLVDYHSSTHKDWLPATVINSDSDNRVVIDLKPNTWLTPEMQAHSLRPRRPTPQHAAAGVATPLRQRSPSMGPVRSSVSSARGSTPGPSAVHGREYSPSPYGPGGPSRPANPSRVRDSSPGRGVAGSRAPSPGHWRGREGSRAGTPSRASTPSRVPSPRSGPSFGPRRSEPGVQSEPVRPPHMPLPRVPGSPLSRRSPAAAAGMAIAGM